MTIEQEFFEAFRIEPEMHEGRDYDSDGNICSWYPEYPSITPEIVLGLVNIIIRYFMTDAVTFAFNENKQEYGVGIEFITEFAYEKPDIKTAYGKTFEECVLNLCIKIQSEIQNEVRKLFEKEKK